MSENQYFKTWITLDYITSQRDISAVGWEVAAMRAVMFSVL